MVLQQLNPIPQTYYTLCSDDGLGVPCREELRMIAPQLLMFILGCLTLGGILIMTFSGYLALTSAPPDKRQRQAWWIYYVGWGSIAAALATVAYVIGYFIVSSVA